MTVLKTGDQARCSRVLFLSTSYSTQVDLHAPMIGSMFSFLLGTKLPGPGTRYLKQSLAFSSSPREGEVITACITVTALRPEKCLADLKTDCFGDDERLICTGRALVKYPKGLAPRS